MKSRHLKIFLILLFLIPALLMAQDNDLRYFKFQVQNKSEINVLSTLISVDNYDGTWVYAYANPKEWAAFSQQNIPYRLIAQPGASKSLSMALSLEEMVGWERYPSYEVYEALMQQFATQYPAICRLEEIGTLASGRKLLVLKITENVSITDQAKPQLFLSSSMHGDEIGGYSVLLQLANHILSNYNQAGYETLSKLVKNAQLWINPLANPNGTYKGGNETVAGASRYNANLIDINRNFPDPAAGEHPDGNAWQEETLLMMDFAEKHPIHLAMNLHSGAELVNYPWDTWSRPTADDAWWAFVGGNYRDSAQANSPEGYFTDVSDGLSNGYDWYRITGGRQDYMNYFRHARELTAEIASTKLYPAEQLPDLFSYNKGALLGFLNQGLFGVQGTVKNTLGQALSAKIEVLNHDMDNSEVYTAPETGFFARYLKAGTYSLNIAADGYADYQIENLVVYDNQSRFFDIVLETPQSKLCLNNNTLFQNLPSGDSATVNLPLLNCGNQNLVYTASIKNAENSSWLILNKTQGEIKPAASDSVTLSFFTRHLPVGIYQTQVIIQADTSYEIPVQFEVKPQYAIQASKKYFNYNLPQQSFAKDTLWLFNTMPTDQTFVLNKNAHWLHINPGEGTLPANDSLAIVVEASADLPVGGYSTQLYLQGTYSMAWPVNLNVDTIPMADFSTDSFKLTLVTGELAADSFCITNNGGGELKVNIQIPESYTSVLSVNKNFASIESKQALNFVFQVNAATLEPGSYLFSVPCLLNQTELLFPIYAEVTTPAQLQITRDSLIQIVYKNQRLYDSMLLLNTGGEELYYTQVFTANASTPWMKTQTANGRIEALDSTYINLIWDAGNLALGNYKGTLAINELLLPVHMKVQEAPILELNKNNITLPIANTQFSDTILLYNSGGSYLNYFLTWSAPDNKPLPALNKTHGVIAPGQKDTVIVSVNPNDMENYRYNNHLIIKYENATIRIPLQITNGAAIKK